VSEQYFLGREPTGDEESGPDGGGQYDGIIWCHDTDRHPDQTNPVEVFRVPDESDAREVLLLIERLGQTHAQACELLARRDALLAALEVALPALDRAALELDSGYFAGKADEVRAAIASARKEPQ
jgi:hypothetical protein